VQSDATVTAADIARLAGVGRAAVSNWRRRHEDFPQPVGGTASSPTFLLGAIREWLQAQGKLAGAPREEQLWQRLRQSVPDANLADLILFAGRLFLGEEGLPRPADEEIVQDLVDVAAAMGKREAFEFLHGRYLESKSRRVFETPEAVADLMVALAGGDVRSVFDPACGSGGLLVAVAKRFPDADLQGQELEEESAFLTSVRLELISTMSRARSRPVVQAGDSLRHDAFRDLKVDLVLANPPFNDRSWGYEELTTDPRWEYGLPPRMEPELAWVQHCMAHLRPGGTAVVLMPPAAANRKSGRRIRAQLLRRGAVDLGAALP
jgi:hypothetical protein